MIKIKIEEKIFKTMEALCPKNNPKIEINNILIDFDNKCAVVTDTRALVRTDIEVDGDTTGKVLLVNSKAKNVIDFDGKIEVNGKSFYYNKTLANNFPDYQRVIPSKAELFEVHDVATDGLTALYRVVKNNNVVIDFVAFSTWLRKLSAVDGFKKDLVDDISNELPILIASDTVDVVIMPLSL